MMRAIAGKKAGVLTEVGLRTFVDPRRDGCRMNQKAWESGEGVVELVTLGGKEQLFFPAFPIECPYHQGQYRRYRRQYQHGKRSFFAGAV